VGAVTYATLEHVAEQARPYPTHILESAETGLCLFAAGFLGHNDAIHFAEAGITTTCVDSDGVRLTEMEMIYPQKWAFVVADAWEFARAAVGSRWDVVSCDTWTGDLMYRSLQTIPLWCSLAAKAVTLTLTLGAEYPVSHGWRDSLYERAPGVYWLVLERE
jgi:hypothetical protein